MWVCPYCGCQGIAASLDFCPHCFADRDPDPVEAEPAEESQSASPGFQVAPGTLDVVALARTLDAPPEAMQDEPEPAMTEPAPEDAKGGEQPW